MRTALVISCMAAGLSACASVGAVTAKNVIAESPQEHVWTLVSMKGLDADYDSTLPDGFVRISNPENFKNIRLTTIYDPANDIIDGGWFSGCNGLFNGVRNPKDLSARREAYGNQWMRSGIQTGCTTLIQQVNADGSKEPPVETMNSLRQYSEDQFLILAPKIAAANVDWDAGLFTYLDSAGNALMQFELLEASQ